MSAAAPLLQLSNLYTAYDKADVLSDVSLSVAPGSITCILGSNGSGKSTIIRSILGLTRPRSGSIRVAGRDITQMPTHLINKVGVACIPEGRKVFPKLTVEENLRIGAYRERSTAVIAERLDRVYGIFPRLRERMRQLGGTMSGGEQAMLSIGRGLMSEPKLLLIDEPSLGLSPLFVQEAFEVVKRINSGGVTVLLVEQNVHQTLAIADYGYVLMQGRVVADGTTDALRDNEEVQKAYFG
jgi:branched-chain amino acid transport system ATP-binding protein